jgi:hypothetical protein
MRSRRSLGLAIVVVLACYGCARPARAPRALDLPAPRDGQLGLVLALHASQCEGNVATLSIIGRPGLRSAVAALGVVLLEDDAAATERVRRALRANDLPVPLLRPERGTRRALAAAAAGGPAIVVIGGDRRVVGALRAPRSPSQLLALVDTLSRLAAATAHH